MKSTIKVVLVISLVLSTAVFTNAEGDLEDGNGCQTCSSVNIEQDFAVTSQPISESTTEAPQSATKIKKGEITFDDELLQFLRIWFNSLLG